MTGKLLRIAAVVLAILGAGAWLAWKLIPGDSPTGLTSELADFWDSRSAVPDLEARLDDILADDPAGQRSSLPVDSTPQSKPKLAWDSLPRTRSDFAMEMVSRPETIRLHQWLRNHQLNPADVEIPAETWETAAAEFEALRRRIARTKDEEVNTSTQEMQLAAERGLVERVKLDREETDEGFVTRVPHDYLAKCTNVYGIHMRGGYGYVFSLDQLPQTRLLVQIRESLTAEYAEQLLTFFTHHGVLKQEDYITLFERFFHKSKTLLK